MDLIGTIESDDELQVEDVQAGSDSELSGSELQLGQRVLEGFMVGDLDEGPSHTRGEKPRSAGDDQENRNGWDFKKGGVLAATEAGDSGDALCTTLQDKIQSRLSEREMGNKGAGDEDDCSGGSGTDEMSDADLYDECAQGDDSSDDDDPLVFCDVDAAGNMVQGSLTNKGKREESEDVEKESPSDVPEDEEEEGEEDGSVSERSQAETGEGDADVDESEEEEPQTKKRKKSVHPDVDEKPIIPASAAACGAAAATASHLKTDVEFADLNLSRPFLKALAEMNFTCATQIQRDVIPVALDGKDVLATAETGSGKTAAFLLPILERIHSSPHVQARVYGGLQKAGDGSETPIIRNMRQVATKAMVLLPTRELASQCYSMLKSICKYSCVTSVLVSGGFDTRNQASLLRRQPDILVCTPGRILDHLINTQAVHLELLEIVVFDEADRLLEMGFRDECREVLRRCRRGRQTMLFSATFSTEVGDLANIALEKPLRIAAQKVNKVVTNLVQEFVPVSDAKFREATLIALCQKTYQARTIIFFPTKKQAHRMAILFGLLGISFAELHGNLSQTQRCEGIDSFQRGEARFLLATDLAGRGLDLQDVLCVINYEAPLEDARYIHRVGRTARMGKEGRSVTLYHGPEEYK